MTVMLESKPEVENRVTKKAKSLGETVEIFFLQLSRKIYTNSKKKKPLHETATDREWIAEFDSFA